MSEDLARVPTSRAFAFTPDGWNVARLVDRHDALAVEVRRLGDGASAPVVHGPDPSLSPEAQLSLPAGDRVLIGISSDEGFRVLQARRTRRTRAGDTDRAWRAEPVAELEVDTARLLPRLAGADWDLLVSCADGVSTIWRIGGDPPGLRRLARIPGLLGGGAWLEPARELAVDLSEPGGRASGYAVDLAGGTYHRLFHVSDDSDDRIVLCDHRRGLLAVTSDWGGHRAAGVADLRGARRVRFFPDPPGEDRPLDVCGRVRDGRLVLRRQRGVRSELTLIDPADPRARVRLAIPDGLVGLPVVCAADRIRFPFTAPTVPTTCASYLLDTHRPGDRFLLDEPPDMGDVSGSDLVKPDVVSFPGPRGDIEALVYRPSPARRHDLVVVALHGGPVGQWSAAFTPELQLFAGLGVTVVAPNYHGSFGYGREFLRALEGGAGSVDVEDVVAVATAAGAGNGRVATVLYGHSYGAFLALVTAASRPWLCDGVVAVAPFVSLSHLASMCTPAVRRLVDLLSGPPEPVGEVDLLRRCADLRAKLLIAHGCEDDVVPIEQSYLLCERLRASGHRDGRTLWFLPLPNEGHAISGRTGVLRLYRQIELFLSEIANQTWVGGTSSRNGTAVPLRHPQERR
ncbi:MAG: prolyl oligopeptidase family serine peptidase [Streptosporangiales bacterium]|nr:prolyl oligopeptidase family serine peptidase [Streptosporangiales bacterium]